ncbi:ATPase, T2SS/T4P/T4SS family [Myxococcus sp. MISCRS1]|uniref:GspE/PulE family protein n=1 Tax=Myxococcus TaxID=32 RepID=UPI001CBEC9E6|nr:type II/IV secretion system protein [Myxococcus sp. MISCRS1]MBZ4396820.1 Flp pilus assembly complex ATPase component TadA [Myxococcus sp. AS-1-15]MBZ4408455.1 Flp pilus assembly complex ATPase component TadA [Myxococcus sp. XM-1-1-1]MCK8496404.1 Flp pilus assembly complex ATPase component TadA [Myxococcus fulvus]MCY0996429.1 ATPase, T2SS/T4P/T4SS family [Myxococcus sp. MISCRS1]
MAQAVSGPNASAVRSRVDFTTLFVLEALVGQGLLTPQQAQEVLAKEPAARARVLKAQTAASGKDAARYDVSPVEVVAAFQVPLANGRGVLDEDRVTEAAARASGLTYRKIDPLKLDMGLATRTVSRPYAQKHVLLPLERTPQGRLVVAVANPFDRELFESFHRLTGLPVEPVLSSKADILKSISDIYGFKKTLARAADDFSAASGGAQVSNFEQLVSLSGTQELEASDRPVVQAVDYLLRYAFDNRASDIHIEPKRATSVVRLRIDGVLHPVYSLPAQVHPPIVSRVKMLSRIDISEKRKPQDGRIKTERDGREVELRVSTLPTAFGEKVVIRIFDPETLVQDIAQLGFEPDEKANFESWIDQPHGLILVTGPTGSGKTTTLYSALKALAGPDVNVTTIEDPIEMVWDAFNQVQVQPKVGLDFAGALRHILRQDPDVIMVGEIRDAETAENAIQSALTGHLVLSTLHTNDALGAVARMRDLGVPSFLLAQSLLGVMAQRLLRRVCSHCAEETSLTPDELLALQAPLPLLPGGVRLLKGAGCVRCRGTGFIGRTGVFEIVTTGRELREHISREAPYEKLVEVARLGGMRTLREAAVRKLAQGLTAFDEVVRMTSA